MSIPYGGFQELIYTSSALGAGATANAVGITTRLNPILDPSNINVRGTGKRGLYDILLGMRQPQFTMDILPTDINFIFTNQTGQNRIPYLHYGVGASGEQPTAGLLFSGVYTNRVSVEARHNEAITATMDMWAEDVTLIFPVDNWDAHDVTPYRWLDSELWIGGVEEDYWWSWRYEVNNNLQRLGNVADGGTRTPGGIKARHKDVSGLIVKDLASFSEWALLMLVDSPAPKFNVTLKVFGNGGPQDPPRSGVAMELINQDACRWGRLEAPVGPEDLQAKRFPFTAIDVT